MPNPAFDSSIARSPVLAAIAAQHPVSGRVSLTPLPEGLVVHILGYNTSKAALLRLAEQAEKRQLSVRELSVDQWFLVSDNPYGAAEMAGLAQDLQPDFVLSDQSAGRVRLRMEGEDVPHILNKGIALDLHIDAFPIEKSTPTLCGHIGVHLTRLGESLFELMV